MHNNDEHWGERGREVFGCNFAAGCTAGTWLTRENEYISGNEGWGNQLTVLAVQRIISNLNPDSRTHG